MWFWNVFIVLLLGASVNCGMSDAEVKALFVKYVLRCTKTHSVPFKELLQLQKFIVPKKMETRCLLACAYKMQGTMNDKGEYDLEAANKFATDAKGDKPEILPKAKEFAQTCAKTNEEQVSDGDKGCDRAALIFKCVTENAPKFGFKT